MTGAFRKVSAGFDHTVALSADRRLVCWDSNVHRQAPPLGLPGPYTDCAAGDCFTLALRVDGDVDCFGWNRWGRAPRTRVKGPFVSISAGYSFGMGLREDGGVEHWGKVGGAGEPPKGIVYGGARGYVAISAGAYHSLALRTDGSAKAFGSYVVVGARIPAEDRPGPFKQVSAGSESSVGLLAHGNALYGWGPTTASLPQAPAYLTIIAVSLNTTTSGHIAAVALYNDGVVRGRQAGYPAGYIWQGSTYFSAKIFPGPDNLAEYGEDGDAGGADGDGDGDGDGADADPVAAFADALVGAPAAANVDALIAQGAALVAELQAGD